MPQPYIDCYYTRTIHAPKQHPTLREHHQTDICVIGGGLSGINTALGLAERGVKVTLLEANQIGWGASGRNGGFVDSGFSDNLVNIADKVGVEHTRTLYQKVSEATDLMRHRMRKYDMQGVDVTEGILYASWFDAEKQTTAYVKAMNNTFGTEYTVMSRDRMQELYSTERYYEGIFKPKGFHMHSLNYVHGIAAAAEQEGAEIFVNSPAVKIDKTATGYTIHTEHGVVDSKQIVVCCSGYLTEEIFPKLKNATLPVETYVMLTEPLGDRMQEVIRAPYAVSDTRFAPDYYRPLKDTRLLWGGRIATLKLPEAELKEAMRRDMLKVYPQLEDVNVEVAWRGTMGYATHKMPQIGKLQDGVWYNMGHGGHGLCSTTLGGELIASAIAENTTDYELFKPFGLTYTGGMLGPIAAQGTYWYYQGKDFVKEIWMNK